MPRFQAETATLRQTIVLFLRMHLRFKKNELVWKIYQNLQSVAQCNLLKIEKIFEIKIGLKQKTGHPGSASIELSKADLVLKICCLGEELHQFLSSTLL